MGGGGRKHGEWIGGVGVGRSELREGKNMKEMTTLPFERNGEL